MADQSSVNSLTEYRYTYELIKNALGSLLFIPSVIIDLITIYINIEPFELLAHLNLEPRGIHFIDEYLYNSYYADGKHHYTRIIEYGNSVDDMVNKYECNVCIQVISFKYNLSIRYIPYYDFRYNGDYLHGMAKHELFVNNEPFESKLPTNMKNTRVVTFQLYNGVLYFGIYYTWFTINVYKFDCTTYKTEYITRCSRGTIYVSDKYIYICYENKIIYTYNMNTRKKKKTRFKHAINKISYITDRNIYGTINNMIDARPVLFAESFRDIIQNKYVLSDTLTYVQFNNDKCCYTHIIYEYWSIKKIEAYVYKIY
jgi:hypothetical protein